MTEAKAFQTDRLRWSGPVWIALVPAVPALAAQFGSGSALAAGIGVALVLLATRLGGGQRISTDGAAPEQPSFEAAPTALIDLPLAPDRSAGSADGLAVAPLAALLRGQVEGVHETVGSAVAGVVGEVEKVHRHAGVQLAGIHRLLDNTGSLDEAVRVPGQIITRLEAMLADRDQTLEHNFSGLQALASRFEALRGTVDTISQVADKAFFLSINAAVESKRHGAAGTAFGLIADEMRRMATQSADTAREVSNGIHDFARQMHDEIARALPDQAGGRDAIAQLVQDMGLAQAALHKNGAALSREVALIDEGHRTIVLHLSGILGGLQFHDVIRQRLEQVADLLVELEQECRVTSAGTASLSQRLTTLLATAEADYVMAAQRQVHRAVMGGGSSAGALALAADEPAIELF